MEAKAAIFPAIFPSASAKRAAPSPLSPAAGRATINARVAEAINDGTIRAAIASRTAGTSSRIQARQERNQRIIELYREGLTTGAIGEIVGLTGTGVWFVLKNAGEPRRGNWDYPRSRSRRYDRTRAQIAPVAGLYNARAGMTATQLAEMTGLCPDSIRAHLHDMGVKLHIGPKPIKLTFEKVRRLKIDLHAEEMSFTDLAVKYGVTAGTISNIAMGRKWKDVPWPTPEGYRRRGRGRRPEIWKRNGVVFGKDDEKPPKRRKQ